MTTYPITVRETGQTVLGALCTKCGCKIYPSTELEMHSARHELLDLLRNDPFQLSNGAARYSAPRKRRINNRGMGRPKKWSGVEIKQQPGRPTGT